jgi:NAD(P)H dehydrogenase (quinone)
MRAAANVGLRAGGHSVREIDLRCFDPVLSRAERLAYVTDTPIVDSQIADYAEAVLSCDAFVFVYATTLSTLPPALKGWLDRVLVPGVSFTLDESGSVAGGLSGIRRIVGISTYDDGWWKTKRTFDNGRRILLRNLRLCTTRSTRTAWLPLYRAANSGEKTIETFSHAVEQRLAKL